MCVWGGGFIDGVGNKVRIALQPGNGCFVAVLVCRFFPQTATLHTFFVSGNLELQYKSMCLNRGDTLFETGDDTGTCVR